MIEETPLDFSQLRTYPLSQRRNKVRFDQLAQPPRVGATFGDFMAALPDLLAVRELRHVVDAILNARSRGRAVCLAIGGHVIKCGLGPVIIDLMRRGLVTSVAMNGSGSIHDFEIALIGETSEDVSETIMDGSFGMADETGRLMNEALLGCLSPNEQLAQRGMGELLGMQLVALDAPNRSSSVLAAGIELGVPITVHVAIGTDIIHMHPAANGAAMGQTSYNDFRRYVSVLRHLESGVYLNIGSAVILPEVFLKAVSVLRNLGISVDHFTAVNLDMIQHYRPLQNVVSRPRGGTGRGVTITGHHELLVPLLAQLLVERCALDASESSYQ